MSKEQTLNEMHDVESNDNNTGKKSKSVSLDNQYLIESVYSDQSVSCIDKDNSDTKQETSTVSDKNINKTNTSVTLDMLLKGIEDFQTEEYSDDEGEKKIRKYSVSRLRKENEGLTPSITDENNKEIITNYKKPALSNIESGMEYEYKYRGRGNNSSSIQQIQPGTSPKIDTNTEIITELQKTGNKQKICCIIL